LLNAGLDYVSRLNAERVPLKKSLEDEINLVKFYSSIKNPIYTELKGFLLTVPNSTREERKKISKLAYELLEFYCNS